MALLDLLYWAVRALSLFNTLVLIWLGLVVLLSGQRRRPAALAASAGLLLGGLFFASHSILVGRELGSVEREIEFWWPGAWLLFIVLPYVWYLAISCYANVAGRQRAIQGGLAALGLPLLGLPLATNLLPTYQQALSQVPVDVPGLAGIPAMALIYPGYSLACEVLAVSALWRPNASTRFMGDLARRRARGWLIATSAVLLVVTIGVAATGAWLLREVQEGRFVAFARPALPAMLAFDLIGTALLTAAAVLLGQAMISYEIFTGKALPSGGLRHHWHTIVALAVGYGAIVASCLALPVDPLYWVLAATILMAVFYAIVTLQASVERDRTIESLRPFVASSRLYEHLLDPGAPHELDVRATFQAVSEGLLGAETACVIALGPLAPLAGSPLMYPQGRRPPVVETSALTGMLKEAPSIGIPLRSGELGGAIWAVPLWSERGLIGVFLLGPKRDGRLYAQEEIEIARGAGERLLDLQATLEMSRRLVVLQRRRLADSEVGDRRARRTLHDDVLPRLHAAILRLSAGDASEEAKRETRDSLMDVHRRLSDLLKDMPAAALPELARLGLFGAIRHVAENELEGHFEEVRWRVGPEAEEAARRLSALTSEVLFSAIREVIRNAARHGRGEDRDRPLHVTIGADARDELRVTVEDNGIGIGGGQRTERDGRGLMLHSTMLAVVGGSLAVEEGYRAGTRVMLTLPLGRQG